MGARVIDFDNYDCQQCGACCVSDFDSVDYVHLREEDLDRLNADEYKQFVYTDATYGKTQCSMRTARDSEGNCRCAALEGQVGKSVSCSIYERRPLVCRKFQPETAECDYARQIYFGVSPK